MKRILFILALLAGLAGTAPAQAIIPTADQSLTMAYKYWGGYCDGSTPEQTVKITYDASLPSQDKAGLATGVLLYDDGSYDLVSCSISIEPGLDPESQCKVIFHEVGHLANQRHTATGIMAVNLDDIGPFWRCEPTLREAVIQSVHTALPPGFTWVVHCNPALTRCKAASPRARRPRRFEVLGRDPGSVYPI